MEKQNVVSQKTLTYNDAAGECHIFICFPGGNIHEDT